MIPLYFILSPGADIVSDVDKLAVMIVEEILLITAFHSCSGLFFFARQVKKGKVKGVDYHNISLGQGQDRIAIEKLDMGHRQVLFAFIHLFYADGKIISCIYAHCIANYRVIGSS